MNSKVILMFTNLTYLDERMVLIQCNHFILNLLSNYFDIRWIYCFERQYIVVIKWVGMLKSD